MEQDAAVSTAHVQRTVAAALRVTLPSVPQGQGITLRKPSEFDWEEHVRDMRPHDFKLRYRLTAEVFYDLLDLLRPDLQNDNQKQEANNSGKGFVVRPVVKLAIALRYLAGGDPLDLKLIYHVSKSYVMDCVWRVVDAVNTRLDNIHFPLHDPEALAELERDFRAGTRGDFWKGQVGAVDGIHFKMQARC